MLVYFTYIYFFITILSQLLYLINLSGPIKANI